SDSWVETSASDPLLIMPTSGTTAKPKPVVHLHGGYQTWNYWTAKWIYGLEPNDIIFNTSDIGWIVGQSYIVFGPLLAGATVIIYDGTPDYPHNGIWWETIAKNRASLFWTSPTGLRMLRRFGTDVAHQHDLSSVKRVVVAGEVLNPEVWRWASLDVFEGEVPVIDHMWQTETTGALFGYPYGLGGKQVMKYIKPGSAGLPVPGVVPVVYDETGLGEVPRGQKGVLYLRKPFPGLTPTLWDSFERYVQSYWEMRVKGLYCTGDAAMIDQDGYIWFSGRADEIIKISGHRVGTVEVESSLLSHPSVVEAGVCGV
ncbi:MAG: acyl-CoA synthetase, partial [Candidatus Caldarchaeum sp.]|nr:acyl-CoA synthetase [Candidatus Caldarchaeum sp.]MDW8436347.1 acyl-CoA synthetase [Candidatus Caldarchaeum sp.]